MLNVALLLTVGKESFLNCVAKKIGHSLSTSVGRTPEGLAVFLQKLSQVRYKRQQEYVHAAGVY